MSPPNTSEEYFQIQEFNPPAQLENNTYENNLNEKRCSILAKRIYFQNVEEEIPFFTVKQKEKSNNCPGTRITENFNYKKRKFSNYRENIPIFIRNISNINIDKSKFGGLMRFFGINFRTVMIYGRCCFVGCRSKSQIKLYSIDDGTGSIIVHFNKHIRNDYIKEISKINNMENELRLFKKHSLPQIVNDIRSEGYNFDMKTISESIDTIYKLLKTNSILPESHFSLGCKVNVIGIPFYIFGSRNTNEEEKDQIRLYAIEMYEDSKPNRDREIFFKKSVLKFYCNNIDFLKDYSG